LKKEEKIDNEKGIVEISSFSGKVLTLELLR